jgi:hypothetical protein
MFQKIKNPSRFSLQKKVVFGLFIFFVLSGFFFPHYPAQAQEDTLCDDYSSFSQILKNLVTPSCYWHTFTSDLWGPIHSVLKWVGKGVKATAYLIFVLFFTILGSIAITFVSLAISIMTYVLSLNFINLSYTNPAGNPIIQAGLQITTYFANIILILVLIYIALATILRLAGYQTKKLLITLVAVALLVNFAPVICGLIVDASNIIMNYLTKNLGEFFSFSDKLSDLWKTLLNEDTWKAESTLAEACVKAFIMTVFGFTAGFAFFTFALIFLARYVAIWVLVILAPLAFVCYILPITKKYALLWWNQFLNWSFIGVTCLFFLYLASILFSKADAIFYNPGIGALGREINILFIYFVPLAFLYVGLVVGLTTSAMGADSIISATKKGGKWARGKGWSGAKFLGSKAREKVVGSEKARRWAERQTATRKWGKGEKGFKGWVKRTASTVNPVRYARRGLGKALSTGLVESEQKRIQQAEEKFKDIRLPNKLEHFHHAMTDNQKIGILNAMIKEGQIDDAMDENKYGKSAIRQAEIERLMKKAKRWESDKKMVGALPHLNAAPTEEDKAKGLLTEANVIRDRISKMKPDDYKNISKAALKNTTVVDAILEKAMGSHISKLIEAHGRTATEEIEKAIMRQKGGLKGQSDIVISATVEKYLRSSAGQAMTGIELPPLAVPEKKDAKGKVIEPFKPGYHRRGHTLIYVPNQSKLEEIKTKEPTTAPSEEIKTEYKKTTKERTKPRGRSGVREEKPPRGRLGA